MHLASDHDPEKSAYANGAHYSASRDNQITRDAGLIGSTHGADHNGSVRQEKAMLFVILRRTAM